MTLDGDDLTLEAARAIRGDLGDLLGAGEEDRRTAGRLDSALAELLARAEQGSDVREQILATLGDLPETRAWTVSFLTFGVPPDLAEHERSVVGTETDPLGGGPPPGAGLSVRVPRFRCPRGDLTWYRRSVGQRVPRCPTHGLELVRVQD